MPKIWWKDLPPALRDHLFERLGERKISAEDLCERKLWRASEPEAPEGAWYKDFGSFKICGEGEYPKTSLLREGRLTPRTHHAEPISLPELEPRVVRETRGPMNQGHSDTMPAETTIALLARASRRHVPQRG